MGRDLHEKRRIIMKFDFGKVNKSRRFTFNAESIKGKYLKLKELFEENGEDYEYQVKGLYISTMSAYNSETPVVATVDGYINLPPFQLNEVKGMIDSEPAVAAINAGYCGFTIIPYEKEIKSNKTGRTSTGVYYKVKWCNVNPLDYDEADVDSEDEEEEF